MKRFFSLFLIILIILSFVACSGENEPNEQSEEQSEATQTAVELKSNVHFNLGYYSNDSIHPFKSKGSVNALLVGLMCDSLVYLDNNFAPQYQLAEKAAVDGKTVTMFLADGLKFSDGSSLSASDVVFSFNMAKESVIYKGRLKNIVSATGSDNKVVFNLQNENIYSLNCLTFPIIKTGDISTDNFIGSGRYVLKKMNSGYMLEKNKNYPFDEELSIDTIYLRDLTQAESPLLLTQIGDLSFYYDDMVVPIDMELKINAGIQNVNACNMVYLAFNDDHEQITNELKKAIYLSLNFNDITNSAFGNGSVAANMLFHPGWEKLADIEQSERKGLNAAKDYLLSVGYKENNGNIFDANGKSLELEIMVSEMDVRKETLANEIAATLNKLGIKVDVDVVQSKTYYSHLNKNRYDIYIGEVKLNPDMDIGVMFEDGYLSKGITISDSLSESLDDFRTGKIDPTTFSKLFFEQIPFLPLSYINGVAYYSHSLNIENAISENAPFADIYSW